MKQLERYLQKHSAMVKAILMLAAIVTLVMSVAAFMPRQQHDPLYAIQGQSVNQTAIRAVFMEEMRKPPPARPTATPPVNMPQAHMHIQLPGGLEKNVRLRAAIDKAMASDLFEMSDVKQRDPPEGISRPRF